MNIAQFGCAVPSRKPIPIRQAPVCSADGCTDVSRGSNAPKADSDRVALDMASILSRTQGRANEQEISHEVRNLL
jgi:hypothetical protein